MTTVGTSVPQPAGARSSGNRLFSPASRYGAFLFVIAVLRAKPMTRRRRT